MLPYGNRTQMEISQRSNGTRRCMGHMDASTITDTAVPDVFRTSTLFKLSRRVYLGTGNAVSADRNMTGGGWGCNDLRSGVTQ